MQRCMPLKNYKNIYILYVKKWVNIYNSTFHTTLLKIKIYGKTTSNLEIGPESGFIYRIDMNIPNMRGLHDFSQLIF